RAGTTTAFNNGTNIPTMLQREDRPCPNLDPLAWYGYNSGQYDSAGNYTVNGKTFPVGQKQPNAWGLYDMHGNVNEWCIDMWKGHRSYRVLRGGGWGNRADLCTSSYRSRDYPSSEYNLNGFRLVRPLSE
ncbi:MAG: formylglycine-generating enzyme family protein, partial [Kiritimatiellae bacterium]|nr:formylglycine-generating enzyme family protein [Kiritimatiellia bacterium]